MYRAGLLRICGGGLATINKGRDGLRKRRIRIEHGAPLKGKASGKINDLGLCYSKDLQPCDNWESRMAVKRAAALLRSEASTAPPPLPVPSPPQTSTDAPASAADPPPPLPWAASMQRKPPRQQPNPNASRAKQAPLPPPCCRRCRHHRCHRRHPRMRRCRRLDIAINAALPPPPKQPCCFALPFFVWNGAGGAYFFLKMELIQLYICNVK
jgi:hypothetical protein